MRKTAFLLTCLMAIGHSTSAYAINWIPLLKDTPAEKFNEDDMNMFLEAGKKALNETPDGQTVSWENPETKAHGSIMVEKTSKRDGQTCKRVRLENAAGKRKAKSALDFCQDADGKWNLATPGKKK